jgi:hypothetical protein
VLLVACDVFEADEADDLDEIMRPLAEMLEPRVANGLSVLMLPGNHDHPSVFPPLERAQQLSGKIPSGTRHVFFLSHS